jgi:hypothetical protein
MTYIRIAPLEKQKVYQLLNYTGGEIVCKKRHLKGALAWDLAIRVKDNFYKGYGSYVDHSEEKSELDIKNGVLKINLGDFFNYWEQREKKKGGFTLVRDVLDKLKKDLNLCLKP